MVDGNTPTNTILVEGSGTSGIDGTYSLSSGQPGQSGAEYVSNSGGSVFGSRILFTNSYIEIYWPEFPMVGRPRASCYINYTLNISSGWETSQYGYLPIPTVKYI